MTKTNPSLAPFFKFGSDVFGQENNLSGPANELVFLRIGLRSDQRQSGSSIRRGNA
jgi:hypothetical protein